VRKEKSQIRTDYMQVVETKVARATNEMREIENDLNDVAKKVRFFFLIL